MSASERREERVSYARQRATIMSSGFSGTAIRLPEGLNFYEAEVGTATLEFLPYVVGKGNPVVQTPGKMYYERTYWVYRKIGADDKSYICSSKSFGKPDYIQELRNVEAKKSNADKDYLKSLSPQMKQLFLVWDHNAPEKGIQLWDFSAHNFGSVLDDRIQASPESKGWDFFYYPDSDGFTLEVALKKDSFAGHNFLKATAIDFTKRDDRTVAKVKELFEEVKARNLCLDNFLIETEYEKLKRIFHSLPEPEGDSASDATTQQETPGKKVDESAKSDNRSVAGEESEADGQQRVYTGGYQAQRHGKKRGDNPFKKESDQYQWWMDGWLASAEEGPAKKEESKKTVTAEDLGISRGSEVVYDGGKCSVVRVCDDGTLTLMTPDDEIVKGITVASVQVAGKEAPPQEKKKEQKKTKEAEKPKDEEPTTDVEGAWDNWK